MKYLKYIIFISILMFIQSVYSNKIQYRLDSPYKPKKNVYKGQLHCHTLRSDGKHSPEQVMGFYYKAGYNFLVFTEHNQLGRRVIPAIIHKSPYKNFIMIPGYEIFSEGHRRPYFYMHHILGIGITKIPPMKGAQYVIDYINKHGGIPILCHPEWRGGFHYTLSTLEKLRGYMHIERTVKWDYLLSKGKKVFMIRSDDFHALKYRHFNKGFVMVYSDKLDQKNILKNIKSGNFYSSNGAIIKSIKVEHDRITIEAPRKSYIAFHCFAGCRVYAKWRVKNLTYKIEGNESYIRARVRYKVNGRYRYAETNPIFIRR